MSDTTVYWDDVEEGQEIPTFERKTDIMHWIELFGRDNPAPA